MRGAFLVTDLRGMRLRIGAGTDTGRVRSLNEDAYMVRTGQGLFVLCDGMGGAPAGEVASQMALAAIERQLNESAGDDTAPVPHAAAYLRNTVRLAEAVRRSNAFVYDQAQKHPGQTGMGTTVVGAWIRDHVASVAHVGDSRAYLWHQGCLEALTRDHSLVEAQIDAGVLTREMTVDSRHEGVLVRVIGREPDVDVDVKEVPLQAGDFLVLCSDGLTRMVPEPMLGHAICRFRDPQRICDYLIAEANRNGGADNITVVIVEVAERWWRSLANRWSARAKRGHDAEVHAAV